jgi:hypothetical protein
MYLAKRLPPGVGKIKFKVWLLLLVITFMVITTLGKALLEPCEHLSEQQNKPIRTVESVKEIFSWEHVKIDTVFKFRKQYTPIWALKLLQLITLLPLCVAAFLSWRSVTFTGSALSCEFKRFIAIFGSALLGYSVLRLSAYLEYIPNIQLDLLVSPRIHWTQGSIIALLMVVASIVMGYLALRYLLHVGKGVYPNAGLALYLTLILIISGITIITRPSLLEYMLLLPVIILWPMILPSRYLTRQLINLLIVVFSFAFFLFFIGYSFPTPFQGDWGWRLMFAISSGFISPSSVIFLLLSISTFLGMIGIAICPPEIRHSQIKFSCR